MQLILTPKPSGALRLSFKAADRAEIVALQAEKTDLDILIEGTEHYWTNGSYHPFDAADGNPFVGLTGAPCIAQCLSHNEDGTITVDGDFWYHNAYMIDSFLDTMLEQGFVDFTKA